MPWRHLCRLLWAYHQDRRWHFTDRTALQAHQQRQRQAFVSRLTARSPWFAPWRDRPWAQWPLMDKALMLAHFDRMNTAGLSLAQVMATAQQAEHSRDFSPQLNTPAGPVTVGLSSGTTAQRGVFVVGEAERARWAGVMLSRALPHSLLRSAWQGERVALFLRANSPLYTAVRHRAIQFEFFDLFAPFDSHWPRLASYQPSILLAPAQVLRQLALAQQRGALALHPARVYAIAEVLEPQDRALIEQVWTPPLHEIYQATEGFLASTCAHGVLHLNEEHLVIEPQWLDSAQRRFVPLITDLHRLIQPIVRYRLDDVLVARDSPCPCGRASMALDRIEGRCNDLLHLPGHDGQPRPVFADVLTRAFARLLPMEMDYQLVQTAPDALQLKADMPLPALHTLQQGLVQVLAGVGVATERLQWSLQAQAPAFDPTRKRRRLQVQPVQQIQQARQEHQTPRP